MERCVYCGKIVERLDDVHYTCLGEPLCPDCALGVSAVVKDVSLLDYIELTEDV